MVSESKIAICVRRYRPGATSSLNLSLHMTITRDDVLSKAIALFGEDKAVPALALVDTYGIESHEREINRVKLAILEVSDGKLARLPYFVKCAKIDYRDLLTGARLGRITDAEEAQWQAPADRMLALWNKEQIL